MIFIGILVVETDPGLYYIDIYVRLKETHDQFEIEPTLDYMNLFVCWVEKDTQDYGLKQIHCEWIGDPQENFSGLK